MISEKRNKKYQELEKSIERFSAKLDRLIKYSSIIGWWRVSIFFLGIISFLTAFFMSLKIFSIIVLLLFLIAFIGISIRQSRILSSIKKFKVWIQIKRDNLARSKLDWQNIPMHKIFNQLEAAQIEIDLDLTGKNSLHQLMDVSKSVEGSLLLRKLMIEMPVDSGEIIKRQDLVKELIALSHFRNKFLLVSSLSSNRELNTSMLTNWLSGTDKSAALRKLLNLLWIMCILNLLFVLLAITGIVSSIYLVTSFL